MSFAEQVSKSNNRVRAIAFYLPQYHPIPENDDWWGKGFTEWTNVTKAKPLFRGHNQPNLPADLGFYDLRVPEVREAQAKLAKAHGIEGFCYWHYWFGNGKRLLDRPFKEVLSSGKPNFPFCLAWANQTWTGIWHGAADRILIEQQYPGEEDYINHFYEILPALRDERYIRVNDKALFVIFRPDELPDLQRFMDLWRTLAVKEGLNGFYFVGLFGLSEIRSKVDSGLDAVTTHPPYDQIGVSLTYRTILRRIIDKFRSIFGLVRPRPLRYNYRDFAEHPFPLGEFMPNFIPTVMPNWDNTPRSKYNGVVLEGANPVRFKVAMTAAANYVRKSGHESNIVFIKSWNEWAEGNYLEPDRDFGVQWLEAVRDSI